MVLGGLNFLSHRTFKKKKMMSYQEVVSIKQEISCPFVKWQRKAKPALPLSTCKPGGQEIRLRVDQTRPDISSLLARVKTFA